MTKERTPKTPRSIIRNHSPYCESTGPIVKEGFVAARVRALQGFSDQIQNVALTHSPLTPCARPSLALKSGLVGTGLPDTGNVKRFHNQILSKQSRNLFSVPGGSASVSDVAPFFRRREQQLFPEPSTPSRSYFRNRGPENPSPDRFEDTVRSFCTQENPDHITGLSSPYGLPSELHKVVSEPAEKSSRSENSILGPHAIQADLVEPRATWYALSQDEDRQNDYIHEQDLKPRGSIADKLISMVEQGWEGGDTVGKVYSDDEFAPHTTDIKFQSPDTRLASRSDSLDEKPHPKQVPSYSGSFTVSTAETWSESQHSTGQVNPPDVKQDEPRTFMQRDLQKRGKRQAKRSPPANTPQRSSSDSGVYHLKTELAIPEEKRRARALHHLGRSRSSHNKTQSEIFPTIGSNYAWDHRYSRQNHGSTTSQSSRECAIQRLGFDPILLRDDHLDQDSAALLKNTKSRRSSSNAKESIRSASRSTSFFKKFPWYKVALVDKQPIVHSLSKGGCGNDMTSRATRALQHDSSSDRIELIRGSSKSHTLVDCGEENESSRKMKTPPHQGAIDQQFINTTTPYYKGSSQASLQLMTSPQEMNERQFSRQLQKVPVCPQDSYATSLKIRSERVSGNPLQVAKDVIGHAQGTARTGPPGTQPNVSPQSGSIDASFESPLLGNFLQPLQPQGPEEKAYSPMQPYPTSNIKSTTLHPNDRLKRSSCSSETTRPEQGFTTSPSRSRELRSEVVNLTPKRLWSGTGSLPTSVDRSDQGAPVRQEVQGQKGIKRIQVTVTFDGAEDLVIEATLRKRNRQKHWRTIA